MNKLTIELGGDPRTFHFGAGFIGNCLEVLGVKYSELFKEMAKNPYKVLPIMMYESYKFNLWLDDKEPDCTHKDFVKWISELPDNASGPMTVFMNAFTESRVKHLEKGKEKPVRRKRSTGTKT